MNSKQPLSPVFRLSAWSGALMAAFATAGYLGSEPWGMLPRVLYMAFGALVAWVVAAYMANMSTTVKALTLGVVGAMLVLGLIAITHP